MKGITLNSKNNIDSVIRQIKKVIKNLPRQPKGAQLFFNPYKIVLNRERYRGEGRPRNSDYDRVLDCKLVEVLKEIKQSSACHGVK